MKEEKLGIITISADGLRKLADSMDAIYTLRTKINLSVWKDDQPGILFFQLSEGTGAISLTGD